MYAGEADGLFPKLKIAQNRYFEIWRSLDKTRGTDHMDSRVDKGLQKLEELIASKCQVGFIPVKSILSLDDDKFKVSPHMCRRYGLVPKKIDKGHGPVQHAIVSPVTSIFLGGHIEQAGENMLNCIQRLVMNLTSTRFPDHVRLDEILVAFDGGWETRTNSDYILEIGGQAFGTRKKESNFIFTFGSTRSDGDRVNIPEFGASGAYFAKLKIDDRGNF